MVISEYWDLYDQQGQKTGELFERSIDAPKLPQGRFHLVVVAWIFHQGQFLLQKRSTTKTYGSGEWSIPGGSVLHGETKAQALLREVAEETGLLISLTNSLFLCREMRDDYLCDAYLCTIEEGSINCIATSEEVDELRWFSIPEIESLMKTEYINKHYTSYRLALQKISDWEGQRKQ